MTIQDSLALSYYKEVADINKAHNVTLVQHRETNKFYVKKVLSVYNRDIFEQLKRTPVKNMPQIFEVIADNDSLIVIEEYIMGSTLQEIIDSKKCLSEQIVADYICQLCDILEQLHSFNPPIIHRDIKPSNIIVTADGDIKLLDLNAAKYADATNTKQQDTRLLGTKGYAAPEQYGFGTSNMRTDIYAVGILMNVLLTGTLSHECTANGRLAPIIRKCIMLDPAQRFSSAGEIKRAITSKQSSKHNNNYLSSKRRFLLPGFRSLNPVYMVMSFTGYMFIVLLCATMDMQGRFATLERIFCLIIFLSVILFSSNYLNVQKYFKLSNIKNKFLKTMGIIVCDIIIIFALLIILYMIEQLYSVLKLF